MYRYANRYVKRIESMSTRHAANIDALEQIEKKKRK